MHVSLQKGNSARSRKMKRASEGLIEQRYVASKLGEVGETDTAAAIYSYLTDYCGNKEVI